MIVVQLGSHQAGRDEGLMPWGALSTTHKNWSRITFDSGCQRSQITRNDREPRSFFLPMDHALSFLGVPR
ncbi:hypothetical protein PAXRUDRAFT_829816 [Paxillus rubicundulus Ve08.2h10]|uniref:Uncharacterized protein n=1 Tax=Paxillus rubicundulus Ve08.2h10 TaxID=930991 RepID=A0A0D0DZK3_9AGAM|nr:hypothetical protein PAXRUDRAFT_829816 [Paxillus rubicundulus Ve08.2h10]